MSRLKAEYKRLKKLVKRNPILYVRLADLELQMGKTREARNRLINGLESDAENSTAHLLLAQAQGRLKDAEGSLKSYEEVLRLDPLNLRARKAYVELLHLLGRTDLEYAAHTRLYELSPSDSETEQKQKELVHWTMKQLFGDDFEWQDDWHPGDITEIGGLSTVVSKELDLLPERAPLPKQFTPDVDDSLVTQMIARLPSNDDDEQVEEFKLPGQKAAEESSNGAGTKDETDGAEAEAEDKDYDPDSNLIQHTEPVEPKPSAPETDPETDSAEPAAESVDDAARDQDAEEAPAVETEPETVAEEAQSTPPQAETTNKPATVDGDDEEEVGVEAMLAELMSEGSGDDTEEAEQEPIPTPLENAVKLGGQSLEHVVDFKQVLTELKEDELVLVEDPDLEATIPEIHEPAKAEDTDESESEQSEEEAATAGDRAESDVEAATESEAEAAAEPEDEPVAEIEVPKAAVEEPKPESEPEKQSSGALNQSDLDALLAQFQSGQAKPESSAGSSEESSETLSKTDNEPVAEAPDAAIEAAPTAEESKAAPASEPTVEKDEPAAPSGPMNQGDLDALMASFKAGSSKPESSSDTAAGDAKPEAGEEPESSEEPEQAAAEETEPEPSEPEAPAAPAGPLDQNSLDELMAAFKAGSKSPKKSVEPEPAVEAEEPVEDQSVAEESAKDEPVAAEPDAELTAQADDGASDVPAANTPSESGRELEKPAASAAQERPPMPEASIPKKPASQEDLDDLISQFASKRRGKPGSQKPVEIGKYASKPQAEEDADPAKSAEETAEPAAETTADDNITEGLKQPEEKVPELTEEELARRSSFSMAPSRVEDEVESLEDQPEAEDETNDLSEAATPHDDEFEPYGMSKSGGEPDAQQADADDIADSEPAPAELEAEPAPEQPEAGEPEVPRPEASAPKQSQPEPEAPRVSELQAKSTPEPQSGAAREPSTATEPTPPPAPEKRPTPAPAPPPPAAQAKPKPKPEPAGMAARPKRTPPPPPKRDETAPEEYRGPVSKTLIRLQIGQGKYDHARAMLNRLRQQSPADPDLEKLAEQIEAAIS